MSEELKIFISWSGNRSRLIAEELKKFLKKIIPQINPWVSDENLSKGGVWSKDIISALKQHSVGLFCLTPENLDSPWMHFEAGALSNSCDDAIICPILFGLIPEDIRGPLSVYQATEFENEDMWKLISELNTQLGNNQHDSTVLKQKYLEMWEEFQSSIEKISKEAITDSFSFVTNVIKVFTKSGFPRPQAGNHAYFSSGFESHELYTNAMELAKHRLYIFGRKNRKAFDKEHKDFFTSLEEKIGKGFDFKVLFLDPKAPRDVLASSHKDSDFRTQLQNSIEQAKSRLKQSNIDINTHCRKYKTSRTIATLVVDDAVVYTPIVLDADGNAKSLTKAPFNVVSVDSEFGKEIVNDFLAKWNTSKPMRF